VFGVASPPVTGEPQRDRVRDLFRGELGAQDDGRAAQVAHDDAGLVGLAAFAVPALDDRRAGRLWVGEEPDGFQAFAVQLQFVLARGPVPARRAGRRAGTGIANG
jgi:hypothetical protein